MKYEEKKRDKNQFGAHYDVPNPPPHNNEIVVSADKEPIKDDGKPSKEELLSILSGMIENIERLPPGAQFSPVTQTDLWALMVWLAGIFRCEK